MYRFEWMFNVLSLNVQGSIKRTGLKISQISLLNVQYDLKNGGLNSLTSCTYNRDLRVYIINLREKHLGVIFSFFVSVTWPKNVTNIPLTPSCLSSHRRARVSSQIICQVSQSAPGVWVYRHIWLQTSHFQLPLF